MRTRFQSGLTLVEVLVALTIAALLGAVAWPSLRGHELRAGRIDAVQALTRVQVVQEQHRSAHGLYAGDMNALQGVASRSAQGRYAIGLELQGGEGYVATARALDAQARDTGCETLSLHVRQGFAQVGPNAGCWLR